MSKFSQLMIQDSNSYIMEMMIFFHDYALMVLIMIMTMIFYMLLFMMKNKFSNLKLLEGQMIEFIWTLLPVGFLVFLAIPSLSILYMTDEISIPSLTIKIIAHQWYWSYEYDDYLNINFDSFMNNNFENSSFRLLDVDNRMVVPVMEEIRFLITSSDVIHSFTIPSVGVKIDAVPGRLNQICSLFQRPGLFYGQCSEICGVNHSFMPICVESSLCKNYLKWLLLK